MSINSARISPTHRSWWNSYYEYYYHTKNINFLMPSLKFISCRCQQVSFHSCCCAYVLDNKDDDIKNVDRRRSDEALDTSLALHSPILCVKLGACNMAAMVCLKCLLVKGFP